MGAALEAFEVRRSVCYRVGEQQSGKAWRWYQSCGLGHRAVSEAGDGGEKDKAKKEVIMKEQLRGEYYAEIEMLLPSLEYNLAPKKAKQKDGTASLCSQASDEPGGALAPAKTNEKLEEHARKVHQWVQTATKSRIRMVYNWHGKERRSHNVPAHMRCLQAFLYRGNANHDGKLDPRVGIAEFQEAVKNRHATGHDGLDDKGNSDMYAKDWEAVAGGA